MERAHRDGTVTAVSRFFVIDGYERTGWLGHRQRFVPVLVPVVLSSHIGNMRPLLVDFCDGLKVNKSFNQWGRQ
jgi:hypothetical protein